MNRPSPGWPQCPPRCGACPHRREDMEESHRIFSCACCRCQCTICPRCDCGNRYCGPECARVARARQRRDASRRFDQTPAGRLGRARRQRDWYNRQKVNLTHTGSSGRPNSARQGLDDSARLAADLAPSTETPDAPPATTRPAQFPPCVPLHPELPEGPSTRLPALAARTARKFSRGVFSGQVRCNFCGRRCDGLARLGHLPLPSRRRRL